MRAFITMDDFEKLSEKVEQIDMPEVFYTIEDIQNYIEPDIVKSLPFAIRLSQQKADNKYAKLARGYLLDVLNKTIIFDD